MRIGIVSPCDVNAFSGYLDPESREKIVFRDSWAPAVNTLILGLLRAGHDVTVFTTHPIEGVLHLKGPHLNIFIVGEYDQYPIKYLHGCWINAKRLKSVVQDHLRDLEILHAHWTYDFAWAAGQFADKIPVVCTVRDWTPIIWKMVTLKDKITWTFRYFLNEAVFRNRNIFFVANSPYTASLIEKKLRRPVPFIPNPIKQSFIREERLSYPDHFVIVSIAQFSDKIKNIKTLMKAFRPFHQKHPDAELWLIGASFVPENKVMKQWAAEGLLQGVKLLGAVNHDELKEVLDHSSLLVHPSLEETFGNTLIEAMARRVPVIGGKDSGAVPYVLDHGKAGCLADVRSVADLRDKMELMYHNVAYREKLIHNATQLIEEQYSELKVTNQYLNLYRQLKSDS